MTFRLPRFSRLPASRLCLVAGLPFFLAASLSSCSSKPEKKKNNPKYAQMKWSQRVDEQFRNPREIQSSFSKKVYNAGKEVENGNFKTKEFAGGKKFRDKKFKTDTYAQADKKSGLLNKMFKGGDKENSMANTAFESPLNRYNEKKPWDADKRSSFAGETFTTRAEPQILKKQETSPRPLILKDGEDASYTEFDIQKLLKKD